MGHLKEALVFLAAAVIAVPLFKRLGLGTVLGYLAAGIAIGPFGLRAVSNVGDILHFSELGVVLLLFVIGLELQPSKLWQMRRTVFGLGTLQVVVTALGLAGIALFFVPSWQTALLIGMALSLSSTAFALQLLAEKNLLASGSGQSAFGILLFQDLAVIPMLAILPALGVSDAEAGGAWWVGTLKVFGVLIGVILVGRYVVREIFRIVAAASSQELFTATSLLIALGTAALVNQVGMSMALGAFLAGVLLADSEYRHEIEADIEPFKGLLLGLFFVAVGMTVNLHLIISHPLLVIALILGLVSIKLVVLYVIGYSRFRNKNDAASMALSISQGGEFAFVLFNMAVGYKIVDGFTSELLIAVVSLSMATTPLLFVCYERWIRPLFSQTTQREYDVAPEHDPVVIIAGFGRVGQVVGRVLWAKHIPFTALDSSSEHIDFIRRFGNKVFYGDASRLDLLRAARADKAQIFVLAIDDIEASIRTVETLKHHFPQLTIIARARNRVHAYKLMSMGITHIFRETFESSLEMTVEVLDALGFDRGDAKLDIERFREHDENLLLSTYQFHTDEKKLVEVAARARAELESLFERDEVRKQKRSA